AQLAGGGALPAWLSFNAGTRTFSGTPTNAFVGTVSIDVIANDGNGGTVTDTFDIVVANTNDAPTVANAIPNQNANEATAFNFQFAANTFADPDVGDTLTYSAQLAGGGALPA
ncbi:putative Ig domain-containing protein, partial [Cellvibrio sp. OA-2007]|uniref:putative Ig domain-containing protein n=1 Tax=Cellvibrio sp. OA-2007 TaxID=529823 RepID=UPI000B1651A3